MAKELKSIIKTAQSLGYEIDKRPFKLNLIGVRNSAATSQKYFDDVIAFFYYDDKGNLVGKVAPGTTDPSVYFLQNPMATRGTAILKSGQYKDTYGIGMHRGEYKALTQQKPVTVIRDNDRNALINYFAPTQTGLFGINIHRASLVRNVPEIGVNSAGCQVFRNSQDFLEMMRLAEKSRELYGNKFTYTLIDERDKLKLRNTAVLIAGLGLLGVAAYLLFKKK